jgi:hypothetical protein
MYIDKLCFSKNYMLYYQCFQQSIGRFVAENFKHRECNTYVHDAALNRYCMEHAEFLVFVQKNH